MSDLSPSLTDKIQHETYGLFPLPVTKYTNPDHDKHKEDILKWMSQQDLKEKHGREAICHNVTQVGDNNECLTALPWIAETLINAVNQHNTNAHLFNTNFAIQDSYLEIADVQAIYAPHEHSNCLFSLTYFVNFNPDQHCPVKWRRNVASNFYPVMQFDSTGFTPYNMTEATFNIKEGDIVIHPSNITHGFDANPTGNRITLTAQIVPVA